MHLVFCLEGALGQVGGCRQHLVRFCEDFPAFSYLEGRLELFHFKGVKVSLLAGRGMGRPSMSSTALNVTLSLVANGSWSGAIESSLIQFS